ncbi:MAG TPA: YhbY family RNA-binding protein [Opitutaceae bacterium]|nr:YhbY family RNA-binding protein [Opitutaceae bacterium]
MESLTGREKTRLRGLGQRLEPALKLGRTGLTPAFAAELRRRLQADELVKLRFLDVDRHQQAELCAQLAAGSGAAFLGSVGRTALFYLPRAAGGA